MKEAPKAARPAPPNLRLAFRRPRRISALMSAAGRGGAAASRCAVRQSGVLFPAALFLLFPASPPSRPAIVITRGGSGKSRAKDEKGGFQRGKVMLQRGRARSRKNKNDGLYSQIRSMRNTL